MTPSEKWHLNTHRLGQPVLFYHRVDSTNTLAASLAHDLSNDGMVILADEQTAGRGQHGRSWQCLPGAGVLLSLIVFPPVQLRRPAMLTAWAAVSVCETILLCTGLETRIKWPNDVFIENGKVCGILIEQAKGTVVGIGLNVNQSTEAFLGAGLIQATSLGQVTGDYLDCHQVARSLIKQLDEEYDRLFQGDLASLEDRWRRRLGLVGKKVIVECQDRVHSGVLRELTFDGLVLEWSGSKAIQIRPEIIKSIR